jgi:hypothetical protein
LSWSNLLSCSPSRLRGCPEDKSWMIYGGTLAHSVILAEDYFTSALSSAAVSEVNEATGICFLRRDVISVGDMRWEWTCKGRVRTVLHQGYRLKS